MTSHSVVPKPRSMGTKALLTDENILTCPWLAGPLEGSKILHSSKGWAAIYKFRVLPKHNPKSFEPSCLLALNLIAETVIPRDIAPPRFTKDAFGPALGCRPSPLAAIFCVLESGYVYGDYP
jgi:hypothetical protein